MVGSVRSILIATWGKPSAWSLVNYRLGNKVERSCSTLPALLKPHLAREPRRPSPALAVEVWPPPPQYLDPL
jgi:hypothetical protein